MLDQAFEALKTYDWGVDPAELKPIEEAIVATHGDEAARAELEARLCTALKEDKPRAAKDYICRKLRVIGTASSVPGLAALLADAELAHMARYALESMPAPEAAEALCNALPELDGDLAVGVISSLGVRQDAKCVPALGKLLGNDDAAVAAASAYALGDIQTPDAAKALGAASPKSDQAKQAVTDASLLCAESLLASGDKAKALAIYTKLAKPDQPKHVRLAATRGMLASKS